MISLAGLKRDMDFMRDLGNILDTFKVAALAQFRFFQRDENINEFFSDEIEKAFRMLPPEKVSVSPYVTEHEASDERKAKAIIAVISDDGFLGGLNSSVVEAALQRRTLFEDEVIVLGERGVRFLEERHERFVPFPGIDEDISYKHVERLRSYILKRFLRKFHEVYIVYPEFLSLTSQRITVTKVLPYMIPPRRRVRRETAVKELLVEPTEPRAVRALVTMWLGYKLLDIFCSAKQSEYAARIMHLEGSVQELTEMKKKLTLQYFRQVHTLRDKTIREISASKILLKEHKR
ncbi:MAG: F0F1 ATP synthase subunit gamma [Candidatus Omnitrophica bacterium]|nr:F0F1 ATP synthase subunit gamma [Candidatus Omnitrophota bacterium]